MDYVGYSVVLEPDQEEPHRYDVHVLALPCCLTYGESIEDALASAAEAVSDYLKVFADDGQTPPVERTPVVTTMISAPGPCPSLAPPEPATPARAVGTLMPPWAAAARHVQRRRRETRSGSDGLDPASLG